MPPNPLRTLTSEQTSDLAIYAVSLFPSLTKTRPSAEHVGIDATEAVEIISPASGPVIRTDKRNAPFFVPTALREAPFTGKTAERYPGQSGKQRSAKHVIAGAMLVLDVDHALKDEADLMLATLDASGLRYAAFSTHSHGKHSRETRMRIVLFLDQALSPDDYPRAWRVLNHALCAGEADVESRHLYQAQGVWSAAPERADQAFRRVGGQRYLSTDAVLSQAPTDSQRTYHGPRAPVGVEPNAWKEGQLIDAVIQLSPLNDYETWIATLAGIHGGVEVGYLDETTGRNLWLEASSWADEPHQQQNGDSRYSPERLWDQTFSAPAEARVGALFGRARDHALATVKREIHTQGFTTEGDAGCQYLARYHRKALNTLIRQTEDKPDACIY